MWNDWPSQSTGMDLKIFNTKIVKCILNKVFIFTFFKDIKWFFFFWLRDIKWFKTYDSYLVIITTTIYRLFNIQWASFWCRLGCLWVGVNVTNDLVVPGLKLPNLLPMVSTVHGSQPPRCGSSNNWIDQNCLKIGGVNALW